VLHRQARDGLGQTAVHVAASRDSVDMMLLLLNYGPDLNAQDANLRTPVMLAASGHTDVLELLLTQCVDLSKRDLKSNTALHYACLNLCEPAALMLLERVSEPECIDATNTDLRTPLHIAAKNGLVLATQTLLEKGASVMAVDVNGYTPALACAPSAPVADCLSMIVHIMIDSIRNDRRSGSLNLSSFNIGSLKVRTSSVAPDTSREGPNNEEEYSEDPESIRSSDSEFY